jgi:hypothetical protein
MTKHHGGGVLAAITGLCVAFGAFQAAAAAAAAQEVPAVPAVEPVAAAAEPWIRKIESKDGTVLELQVAVREFVHADPSRPRITVAGAVHIGEAEFYQQLQEVLNPLDVVLFEGVKPRRGESDAEAAAMTQSRMRIIGMMADRFRQEKGRYPDSIAEMQDLWPDAAAVKAPRDAWGAELIYMPAEGDDAGWEIISLGADGLEGGAGVDADIRMSSGDGEQGGGDARTRQRPEGMQKQLASALGVVFQLEAMDHTGRNWRNSDISVEELQERFKEAGVKADGLLGMLNGSSMMARFSGVLLSMLSSTDQSRAILKAVMIETLGEADRMMEQMPGGMGAMMTVIIDERNEIVLEDMERIFADEPGVRTLGVIYGAGHLAHFQRRLTADMGFEVAGERWLTAMIVDTTAAGVPPGQLRQMRQMIQRSMENQPQRRRR